MAGGIGDLATLGVEIDSSDVEATGVRFQDLIRAARDVEQAINTISGAARTTGGSLSQAGNSASTVAAGLDKVATSSRGIQSGMQSATQALGRAIASFTDLVNKVDGAERSLEQFVTVGTRLDAGLDSRTQKLRAAAGATNELAQSVRDLSRAQESAGGSGGAGGGGRGGGASPPGGGPPSVPPAGGGSSGGSGEDARIARLIEQYLTKIGQTSRSGRELEQYTAVRRVGADEAALTAEQQGLSEIAGQYYDIARAAKLAQDAETARARQAGSQYNQRLNESFGISTPAGDPGRASARDSAAVFRENFAAQEAQAAEMQRLADLRRQQSAGQFGAGLNAQYNNFQSQGGSARDSARVFEENFRAQEAAQKEAADQAQRMADMRRQQSAGQFGADLNAQYNNFEPQAGSARDSARVFEEAAKAADDYADRAEKLRARLDPAYAAQQKFNSEAAEARTLLDQGAINATEYAAAIAAATQRQDAFNASLGAESAKLQDSLNKRAEALRGRLDPSYAIQQQYNRDTEEANQLRAAGRISPAEHGQAMTAANDRMSESYANMFAPERREAEAYKRQADDLRASLDPLYSSQRRFNQEFEKASELYRRGYISLDTYQSAVQQSRERQSAFNATIEDGGKKAGLTGQQYFWMLSNVKDFTNQISAGGSLTTALMQQGPMLYQIAAMGQGGVRGTMQGFGTLIKEYFSQPTADAAGAGLDDVARGMNRSGARAAAGGAVSTGAASVVGGAVAEGFAGDTDKVGSALTRFRVPVSAAIVGIGALSAAILALYAAGDSKAKALDRATFGVGRRTGLTAGQLEDVAQSSADAGAGVSRATSREIVTTMASTGNISGSNLGQAARTVKDYAYTTGQELVPAAKELAEALDGSAGGVDRLNAKIGFLNSSTREMYNQMVASGDKTGAQRLLLDALASSLENANAKLGFFARTWNLLRSGASNALDAIEMGLDNLVSGGSLEKQIEKAEKDVAALRQRQAQSAGSSSNFWDAIEGTGGANQDLENAEARLKKLTDQMDKFNQSVRDQNAAKKSLAIDEIVRGLNPLNDQLVKAKANLDNLQQARFNWEIPVDKIKETDAAILALRRQIQQMSEDLKAGGASFNEMSIAAGRARESANFTPGNRTVFEAQGSTAEQIRTLNRSPTGLIANDPVLEAAERQRINANPNAAERDQQLKDLESSIDLFRRQIETLNKVEADRIAVVQNQTRVQSASAGGMFSRTPAEVQRLIENAQAGGAGRNVNQDIIASLIKNESSFNPNADANLTYKNSHAYGYTQLQPGTARDLGVNPRDPQDNVRGGLKYLSQMLDMFNQDMFTALAAYKSGPGATAAALKQTGQVTADGAKYARMVMRDAGMDPGAGGPRTPGATDARRFEERQSIAMQRGQVNAEARFGGTDQRSLDATIKYQELYNAELQKTGQVLPETAAQLRRIAEGFADLNQQASQTRLGKDMAFQLEQLGRNPVEQAGYARLRSAGISPDTDMGKALLQQSEYLENMTMMKGMAGDVWGSISQGILSGASATDIAISAIGKLESKLLDMAGNEIINSLFKMMQGGGAGGTGGMGGGLGGLLGSIGGLLGIGGGAGAAAGAAGGGWGGLPMTGGEWFATGGIMTPRGRMPLNYYSKGGVANSPQMAVFGEGSMNEAYVPLPDGRSIPVTLDRGTPQTSSVAGAGPTFVAQMPQTGSSGNARADREAADNAARTMEATFRQMQQNLLTNEMRPGGMIYRSGARRSNSSF